jgi:hypothetical protein
MSVHSSVPRDKNYIIIQRAEEQKKREVRVRAVYSMHEGKRWCGGMAQGTNKAGRTKAKAIGDTQSLKCQKPPRTRTVRTGAIVDFLLRDNTLFPAHISDLSAQRGIAKHTHTVFTPGHCPVTEAFTYPSLAFTCIHSPEDHYSKPTESRECESIACTMTGDLPEVSSH